MTGHGAKFPRKTEEAIAALVTRPSVEEAARTISVQPKTLRRWMRLPEFQAAYLQVRREAVTQALARLQQGSGVAATVIFKILVDVNAPASVRLRAADCLFQHAIKGVELEDIEVRVAELERATESSKSKR
jgi:hypothetical protein